MQIEVTRRAGAIIGGVLIAGLILIGGTAAFADQASNHRQSEEAIGSRMEKRNDHALDVLREEMHQQKIVAVRTAAKAARASQKKHDRRVMRRIAKKQEDRREREKNAAPAAGTSAQLRATQGRGRGLLRRLEERSLRSARTTCTYC